MANKLSNIKISEGSLVAKGANQHANVVLFKMDKGGDGDEEIKEATGLIEKFSETIKKVGKKISGNRISTMHKMKAMMDETSGLMQQMMDEVEPPKKDDEDKNFITKKGDGNMPLSDEIRKSLDEDAQSYIDELEKKAEIVDELEGKVEELEKQVDEAINKQDDSDEVDIWKGVNPAIKKQFEDMEAKAAESAEIAKQEREARINKEYEEKAKDYSHVGSVEDVSKMLKNAYSISDESGLLLEKTLKANQEKIEKGKLYDEIGSGSNGTNGDAWDTIEAKASEMVQKDGALTKEKAIAQFLDTPEGKELYNQHIIEGSVK